MKRKLNYSPVSKAPPPEPKPFVSIWDMEGGILVNKDCCEDPRREYKVYILANLDATRYLTPSTLNLK